MHIVNIMSEYSNKISRNLTCVMSVLVVCSRTGVLIPDSLVSKFCCRSPDLQLKKIALGRGVFINW